MMQATKRIGWAACCCIALLCSAQAQPTDTHANFQSVTEGGATAWTNTHPVTLRGVILNNPEEWLPGEWDADAEADGRMGAQWQIVVQAVEAGDRGGTACWMGQNYSSLPWVFGHSYSEAEWASEMQRLNFDGAHQFRKGDLVDVTANVSLPFGGKRNINEAHSTNPANDFSIQLVTPGFGLPEPEVITLADVVHPYDGNADTKECIFDPSRQSGGEYYQSMRVRIESVRFATPEEYTPPQNYYRPNDSTNGWGVGGAFCTVTDGEGRFFRVRMPMHDLGPLPNGWFSAEGILNQESGSGDGTFGYELFLQAVGPTLRQIQVGGQTMILWPATYTNYVLEYTTDLEDSSWTNVITAPVRWIAVEEELGEEPRYYRLRQQQE